MTGADGKRLRLQVKNSMLSFCTVAHWIDREIVEEKLFYDKMELMRQNRPDVTNIAFVMC